MNSALLNQLREANMFVLLVFDEVLESPPYLKRPIRFWLDTPSGRIQMTAGACWDHSLKIGSKTYVSLHDVKLQHDAFESPNDFIDKLTTSFEIQSDTKIHLLLSEVGLSEMRIEAFKDQSETLPLYPVDTWCSINGKHLPLTPMFHFSPTAPKRG